MTDEKYTFETARVRLEEIAAEVRKKDTSLEKSLDLLEEGVRLANICTDLVDHTDMTVATPAEEARDVAADDDAVGPAESAQVDDTVGPAESAQVDEYDGFEDDEHDLEEPADAASGD